MKVEILTPYDGWILHRMANHIAERVEGIEVVKELSGSADVVYFLHYHMFRQQDKPNAALFTHLEPEKHPLHKRWFEVAEKTDTCVSLCEMYIDALPPLKTRVIYPGIDERYTPRRLRVGTACQWAHHNEYRKGMDLLNRLNAECSDWLNLKLTNGMVEDSKMLAWFRGLDVYLVASRYESVPMPALEAAACGLKIVAPRVGLIEELAEYAPVIFYETGNYDDMVEALWSLASYGDLREKFSWDIFASQHEQLFKELANG